MRRGYEAYVGEDMQILVNGLTMDYVDSFNVRVEYTMHDVPLPGNQFVGNRKGQGRISGTMSGFLYSDYLMKAALGKTTTVDVVGMLVNPKTKKKYKVDVQDIQFTTADLMNATVGQPVKFELPFTAENIKGFD